MQLKCIDYKDLESCVYISSFKQNWLEYFTEYLNLNVLSPTPLTSPHDKGRAKSSAIIVLPQCFGLASTRKLLG